MYVDILGSEYEIAYKNYSDEPYFADKSCDGFCDSTDRKIVICHLKTHPNYSNEDESYCKRVEKYILRHEIIHAFLNESGLQDSALSPPFAWAKNEEMIDYFAIQLPKITNVCKKLKLL